MPYYVGGDNLYGRGDYYLGDYYQGDLLGGILGGITGLITGGPVGALAGAVTGATSRKAATAGTAIVSRGLGMAGSLPGPVGGAARFTGGLVNVATAPVIRAMGGTSASAGSVGALPPPPGGMALTAPGGLPSAGGPNFAGIHPALPRGYHLNKLDRKAQVKQLNGQALTPGLYRSLGNVVNHVVKNRSMNSLNWHAAKRAIRRIRGAHKMLKRIERAMPKRPAAKARAARKR